MKFLRTISTGRLLATVAGLAVIAAAGAAIAVGASGSGTPPPAQPLATSLHQALTAPREPGVFADVTFTNNLISGADFAGGPKDPILQGATGRIWIGANHQMRLELQSDNGDAQIVVNGNRFSITDPASKTVYQGTLPASATGSKDAQKKDAAGRGIPTIAQIQSDINRLMGHLTLSGAQTSDPTIVAGQPAYSVSVSPKHSGGLLGDLQLAWDAATGVPLDIQVHASGNPTPVLELVANDISYKPIDPSVFDVTPPSGDKVVRIATPSGAAKHSKKGTKHALLTGVRLVAAHLPFTLGAPASVVGMPRHDVKLLDWGGKPAALVTYGQNLGGVAVIEQTASSATTHGTSPGSSSDSGPGAGKLSLPAVTIADAAHRPLASGQELRTALGTVLRFTHHGVAYTVIGSVPPYVAERAAAAVLAGP